jgi:hypothetical protein
MVRHGIRGLVGGGAATMAEGLIQAYQRVANAMGGLKLGENLTIGVSFYLAKSREQAIREMDRDQWQYPGRHAYPRSAWQTIAKAAATWSRQAETDGLQRSTRRQYAQHIVRLISTVRLAHLKVVDVKHFRNALAGAGHSRAIAEEDRLEPRLDPR